MRQTRLHLQAANAAYFRQTAPANAVQNLNACVGSLLNGERDTLLRMGEMEKRYKHLLKAHNQLSDQMRDLLHTRSIQQAALGGCPTSVIMNIKRRMGEMESHLDTYFGNRSHNP